MSTCTSFFHVGQLSGSLEDEEGSGSSSKVPCLIMRYWSRSSLIVDVWEGSSISKEAASFDSAGELTDEGLVVVIVKVFESLLCR